jgi:hypothetical protein
MLLDSSRNKGAGVCHFAEAARLRSYPSHTNRISHVIRITITHPPLFLYSEKITYII